MNNTEDFGIKSDGMTTIKVFEAYARDVGRGVARLDYETMDEIKVKTGGFIIIRSEKSQTVGKVLPLYPSDEGKKIVRLDGIMRQNACTQIGDNTKIAKIELKNAEQITVVPLDAIPPIDERYLTDALENVPIMLHDVIKIPYFGSHVDFKISEIRPNTVVLITRLTIFKIRDGAVSEELLPFFNAIKEKRDKIIFELKEAIKTITNNDDLEEKLLRLLVKLQKLDTSKSIASKTFYDVK